MHSPSDSGIYKFLFSTKYLLIFGLLLGGYTGSISAQTDMTGSQKTDPGGNDLNKEEMIENFQMKKLFGNQQTFSITQDRRNITYFGYSGGLVEFDGYEWRSIELPSDKTVNAVAMNDNGRIFVGGPDLLGYLMIDDQGNTRFHSLSHKLNKSTGTAGNIIEIHTFGTSVLFVTETKVMMWDGVRLQMMVSELEILTAHYIPKTNILYVVDKKQGLMKLKGRHLEPVPLGEQIRSQVLLNYDENNLLIVTPSRGVYLYDTRQERKKKKEPFTKWNTENDRYFRMNRVSGATILHDRYVVFSSFEKGLSIFDKNGKHIANIGSADGMMNNVAYDVYVNRRDNLWVGLHGGVSLVKAYKILPDLERKEKITSSAGTAQDRSRASDSLETESNIPVDVESDTSLYQRYLNTLTDYWQSLFEEEQQRDPIKAKLNPDDTDFASIIRRVESIKDDSLIFGGAYAETGRNVSSLQQTDSMKFKFPHHLKALRFSYATNYYENVEKTEFQVFLKGLDTDWSPWSSRNIREYTNLHWGDYTFYVRARNVNGKKSKLASFSFTIIPPWYEAMWFYWLQIGILLACLTFSFFLNKMGRALKLSDVLITIVVVVTFKYLNLYISPYLFQYSQGIAIFKIGISFVMGLSIGPVENAFRRFLEHMTSYDEIAEAEEESTGETALEDESKATAHKQEEDANATFESSGSDSYSSSDQS